jgi:BirA family biotin operon repressor/biotin-[acetyl-CoA-carboxylase] ligase
VDLCQVHQALQQPLSALGVRPELGGVRPRFQVQWVEETGSTNQDLMAQMVQGAAAGTVLLATAQRQGRGQWGRQWQSSAGGLYLSLGLRPEIAVSRSRYLTLASAWGLAASLRNLGVSVQVKWPNDLVVAGRKLGGILVDTRTQGDQVSVAVVGLGLNYRNTVPPTGIALASMVNDLPAQDLPAQGHAAAPHPLTSLEGVAAVALYGLVQGYHLWRHWGDSRFLAQYQQGMTHLGQLVVINHQPGVVVGLAPSGNLIVRLSSGEHGAPREAEVQPGEVTLGYNA